MFLNFFTALAQKTSCVSLIKLDEITTSIIDYFMSSSRKACEKSVSTFSKFGGMDSSDLTLTVGTQRKPIQNGDTFCGPRSANTVPCFIWESQKFLRQACNAFCEVVSDSEDCKQHKFGALMEVTERQHFMKANWSYTIALKYFGRRHY